MAKTPTLEELLKRGPADFGKLRAAGSVPAEHTGATLTDVFCARVDLSNMGLVGTEWDSCRLEQVSFAGADLSNSYFHGGAFKDCDFKGANLSGATFEKLKLQGCDFTGAAGLDELELDEVDQRDVLGLEPLDAGE